MNKIGIFIILIGMMSFSINLAKDPMQFLIDRFEKKMDINLYFHKNFEKQHNELHKCYSADGPYCKFLNDMILGKIPNQNDREILAIKQTLIENIKKLASELQMKEKKNPNNMFFFPPSELTNLLDKKFESKEKEKLNEFSEKTLDEEKDVNKNIEALLDFENIPLEENEYSFDFTLKVGVENTGGISSDLSVYFNDFKIPSKELVVEKQKKKKNEFLDDILEIEDPERTYIFTEEKKGTIQFEIPIKLNYLFIRWHNFEKQKNQLNFKPDFELKGFLDSKIVYTLTVSNPMLHYNNWIRIDASSNLKAIDKLEFQENIDIDNISFYYEQETIKEKLNKLLHEIIEKVKEKNSNKEEIKPKKQTTPIIPESINDFNEGTDEEDDILNELTKELENLVENKKKQKNDKTESTINKNKEDLKNKIEKDHILKELNSLPDLSIEEMQFAVKDQDLLEKLFNLELANLPDDLQEEFKKLKKNNDKKSFKLAFQKLITVIQNKEKEKNDENKNENLKEKGKLKENKKIKKEEL